MIRRMTFNFPHVILIIALVLAVPARGAAMTTAATYQSETYGYVVAFGEDWQLVDQVRAAGFDQIQLRSEHSIVEITGFDSTGTPATCVHDQLSDLLRRRSEGVLDARFAKDRRGGLVLVEGRGSASGLILFSFDNDADPPVDYAVYVECRSLLPGRAMLALTHYSPEADFGAESPARETLFAAVELSPTLAVPGLLGPH